MPECPDPTPCLGTYAHIHIHAHTHRQLNVLRVELSELVAALRPAPERALASLSDLLPRLAFSAYNSFISAVHSATRRLNTVRAVLMGFWVFLGVHLTAAV